MPENKPISAATSFMSQVTNTGDWQPIDMKHAAIYFFYQNAERSQGKNNF